MGRLGLLPQNFKPGNSAAINADALEETLAIAGLDGLELEGMFTHFATADSSDKAYAEKQLHLFMNYLKRLHQDGLNPPVRHAANSAALIDMPQSHLEMVRPGIAIYGLYPSDEVNKMQVSLKPAMALKARIIQLKKVPAGFNVSYGITHQNPKAHHHRHGSGRLRRRVEPPVMPPAVRCWSTGSGSLLSAGSVWT